MPIAAQNWDAGTTTPAGWSFDAGFAITANANATSAPNVLQWSGTSNGTWCASIDQLDGASGNVVVAAKFQWGGSPKNHSEMGVIARATDYPVLSQGAGNFYTGWVDAVGAACGISVWSGGNEFPVASTGLGVGISSGQWYAIALTADGTTLSLVVTRLSDGYTIDPAGNWSATAAVACSGTDETVTDAGYAGLFAKVQSFSSFTGISDDWSLSSLAPPVTPPLVFLPGAAVRHAHAAPGRAPLLFPLASQAPPPPAAHLVPAIAEAAPGRARPRRMAPLVAPPAGAAVVTAHAPRPAPRRRPSIERPALAFVPPITVPPLHGVAAVPSPFRPRTTRPKRPALAPPVTSFYPDTVFPTGPFSLGSFSSS